METQTVNETAEESLKVEDSLKVEEPLRDKESLKADEQQQPKSTGEIIRELKEKNLLLEEELKNFKIKGDQLEEKLETMSLRFDSLCSRYILLQSKIASLNFFLQSDNLLRGAEYDIQSVQWSANSPLRMSKKEESQTQCAQNPLHGAQHTTNWAQNVTNWTQNSGLCAESSNDWAQSSNLWAQSLNLWTESLNLCAQSLKIWTQSSKLCAQSSKDWTQSSKDWTLSLKLCAQSLNGCAQSLNRCTQSLNEEIQRLAFIPAGSKIEETGSIEQVQQAIGQTQTLKAEGVSNAEVIMNNPGLLERFKLIIKEALPGLVSNSKEKSRLKNSVILDRIAGEVLLFFKNGKTTSGEMKKLFNTGRNTPLTDVRILKEIGWVVFQGGPRKGEYVKTKQFDEAISSLSEKLSRA